MNLLAAKLYDPAAAVSKATSALLAMTAFDTTNLRLAITVPAHGMIFVRVQGGGITGATTVPTIFLGVLNGAAVLARVAPRDYPGAMNAATQTAPLFAEFIITGLTPGAMNIDLAYGVEVVVASTNIKYGGPNDTTTNNAWGGISFSIWDPQPLPTAAPGATNGVALVGSNMGTASSVTGSVGSVTGAVGSVTGAVGSVTAAVSVTGDLSATMKTSVTTACTAATPTAAAVTGAVGSVTGNVGGNVAGSVASVTAAVTLPSIPANWITASGVNAAALNGKGDWNVGKTGYSLSVTPLAAASYTAPDNASISAIKAKTDGLAFTVAGYVDAGVYKINGTTVLGTGAAADLWRG